MPYNKPICIYHIDHFKKHIKEIKKRAKEDRRSLSAEICMAIQDYVCDDNFDTKKFQRYIVAHPEQKDRISGLLD